MAESTALRSARLPAWPINHATCSCPDASAGNFNRSGYKTAAACRDAGGGFVLLLRVSSGLVCIERIQRTPRLPGYFLCFPRGTLCRLGQLCIGRSDRARLGGCLGVAAGTNQRLPVPLRLVGVFSSEVGDGLVEARG